MKTRYRMVAAGALSGWLLAAAPWAPGAPGRAWAGTVNRIVAVVNDEVITEADVASHVAALREESEASALDDAGFGEMHRVVLRRLIEQRLLRQEAKRSGIVVASDEVLARFEEFRRRFDIEDMFQEFMAASGLSPEQIKEKIRDQLMVDRLIDTKIRSTIKVSPQEVARELDLHPELVKTGDRIRASHLLIRVNESRSEEDARTLITHIRDQLARGEEFAGLAQRYSEDPQREEGGAMGWVAPGELMPELDLALFRLAPGELSEPVQTKLGFHLVRAEERRTASDLSVMEANAAVYQQLYQRKFQPAVTRWLTELKRHAYIEIVAEP